MNGCSRLSAGLRAMAYVPAMTIRGAVSGTVAAASFTGRIGAGLGWLAGKPVSKAVVMTCKMLNKHRRQDNQIDCKKIASRTVKAFQMAGAVLSIAGISYIATGALSAPAQAVLFGTLPVIGAVGNTLRACFGKDSFKTVYRELKSYGVSPTARQNLTGPLLVNVFSDITHGDARGRNHFKRLSKSAVRYNRQRRALAEKFARSQAQTSELQKPLIPVTDFTPPVSEPLVTEPSAVAPTASATPSQVVEMPSHRTPEATATPEAAVHSTQDNGDDNTSFSKGLTSNDHTAESLSEESSSVYTSCNSSMSKP